MIKIYKGIFWYNPTKKKLIVKKVACNSNGEAIEHVEYSSKSMSNFNHKAEWSKLPKSITKDERMLALCDEILMFWDGSSKATRENLEDGLRMKKPTKAVLRPFEVRELKIDEDIENIVGDIALMNVLGVDGELLEDLRKYLSQLEDSGEEITYDKISQWVWENRK